MLKERIADPAFRKLIERLSLDRIRTLEVIEMKLSVPSSAAMEK